MKVTRRRLLKSAGASIAAGTASMLIPQRAGAHGDGMPDGAAPVEGMEGGTESQRVRRFVMVIDLRACDGCIGLGIPPQCTQNCNWARFVPDGQQWIEVFQEHLNEHPESGHQAFLPAPCMQCQNAPCVNVCPVGATFHTPEGVVLVDQERCIGCRLCMAACPYDRRFFNWDDPVQPEPAASAPYNVETQVPAERGTVMKCDFCLDRAAAGGIPMCAETCSRGVIYFGDFEEGVATNGKVMVNLDELLGLPGVQRYKEDLGTQPRVYYIPGHGEDAMAATDSHHGDMASGQEEGDADPFAAQVGIFGGDRLEWPWKRIVEYQQQLSNGATKEVTGG